MHAASSDMELGHLVGAWLAWLERVIAQLRRREELVEIGTRGDRRPGPARQPVCECVPPQSEVVHHRQRGPHLP